MRRQCTAARHDQRGQGRHSCRGRVSFLRARWESVQLDEHHLASLEHADAADGAAAQRTWDPPGSRSPRRGTRAAGPVRRAARSDRCARSLPWRALSATATCRVSSSMTCCCASTGWLQRRIPEPGSTAYVRQLSPPITTQALSPSCRGGTRREDPSLGSRIRQHRAWHRRGRGRGGTDQRPHSFQ